MPHPVPQSRRIFLQRAGSPPSRWPEAPRSSTRCASSGGGNTDDNRGERKPTRTRSAWRPGRRSRRHLQRRLRRRLRQVPRGAVQRRSSADAEINHKAITDIRQQLQPRFNAGNPPDVLDNAGAEQLPISTLADTGQLADLTALFDADAIGIDGGNGPGHPQPGGDRGRRLRRQAAGAQLRAQVYGLWYDQTLFDEKGWEPAETWDDFIALCEEIKGAGHRADGPPGQVPVLHPAGDDGPGRQARRPEVVYAIDSLEPDAWKHPSMKMAAEALLEIKAKGYMLEGTEGLDHIQSQTALERGQGGVHPLRLVAGERAEERRAAGLRHDRRPDPAAGRRRRCRSTAPGRGRRGVHRARPRPRTCAGGLEYLRIMLSKEGAAKFTELTAAPTVVNGAAEGLELTPGARRRPSR